MVLQWGTILVLNANFMRIVHPDNKPSDTEKSSEYFETTMGIRSLTNNLLTQMRFKKLAIDAATTSDNNPQENKIRIYRLIGGLFGEESVRKLVKQVDSSSLEDVFLEALYDYEIPDSEIEIGSKSNPRGDESTKLEIPVRKN